MDGLHHLKQLRSVLRRCTCDERGVDHERYAIDVEDPQEIDLTGPAEEPLAPTRVQPHAELGLVAATEVCSGGHRPLEVRAREAVDPRVGRCRYAEPLLAGESRRQAIG